MPSEARTARSTSSSWVTGAPNSASTPSPAMSFTVPPKASTVFTIRATASATTRRTSSGSSRSPSWVEPTRSAKTAVTTLRSSRITAGSGRGAVPVSNPPVLTARHCDVARVGADDPRDSARQHGLGLGRLTHPPPAGIDEVGLHHDHRAADVQRTGDGLDVTVADGAEEVRLRLDGAGAGAGGEVEEGAHSTGAVGKAHQRAPMADAGGGAAIRGPGEGCPDLGGIGHGELDAERHREGHGGEQGGGALRWL